MIAITLENYLMGRDKISPLTEAMKADALTTVSRVNELLSAFGTSRKVTSGYRPELINAGVSHAAKHSNHIICRACDLEDLDSKLNLFCKSNEQLLESIGLWCEERQGVWQHVQIIPPSSGHRWFFP